jgi:hypothetical protein
MICAGEITNKPLSGHHMQFHDWFLTIHEEVEIFAPSPLPSTYFEWPTFPSR